MSSNAEGVAGSPDALSERSTRGLRWSRHPIHDEAERDRDCTRAERHDDDPGIGCGPSVEIALVRCAGSRTTAPTRMSSPRVSPAHARNPDVHYHLPKVVDGLWPRFGWDKSAAERQTNRLADNSSLR